MIVSPAKRIMNIDKSARGLLVKISITNLTTAFLGKYVKMKPKHVPKLI